MVQSPPTGQDHQPASPAVVLATPAPMAAEQLGQEAKTLVCSTSGQPTGGSSFQEPAGLAVEQAGKLPTPTGLARDTTEGLQLQLAVNEPAFPRQQTYQEKEMGRGSREAAPPSRTGEEMLADLEESEPQLEASELLHIENSVQQHVASGLLGSPQEPPAPTEVIGLQTHQPLLEQQLGQPVLSTVGSPPQDKVMQPGSGQERSKLPGLGLKTAAQEEPTCEVQARGAEPMASPPGPLAPTGSLLEVGTPQPDQQRQHGGGEPQPQCLQDDPPYMTQPIPPALQAPPAASLGQDMGPLPPQPQEEIEQPQPLLHLEEAPVTTAQTGRAEPASDELSAVRSTLDTEPLQVPLQEEQGQSMQLRQPFLEETTTCKPQAVGAEPPLPAPEAANIVAFQGDVIPLPQMQQADQGQSQPPQHQQEGSVGNAEAVGAEPVLPATETPTDRSSGLEVSTLPPQQQQQQGDPQGQPEQLPLQQENTDGTEQLTEAQVQPPAPAAGEGTKSLLEVPSLTSSQQQQQVEEFQQAQQQEHLLQRDQHHQLDEHQDESPKQAQHVRPGAEHPQQQGGPPQLLPHLEIPRQEEVGPQQAAGESKEAQPSHIGQLVVPLPQQLQQVASPAAGPEELAHLITQVEQRDIQRVPPSTRLQCSSKREPSEDVPLSSMPDASALVLHSQALQVHHQLQPLARPLTAFPVQRIQAAMGSGLTVMRDRLKTAVERETNLRLETELAAVDQLEALQARALAEANSEVERQARVLAEQEVEQLRSTMQDERRRTQQEVIQLRSELKASHAAIKALEKQVASLQAELGAAVQQKTSAEQQLERVMQRQARPMTSIPAMHADSVAAGHLMVPPQAWQDAPAFSGRCAAVAAGQAAGGSPMGISRSNCEPAPPSHWQAWHQQPQAGSQLGEPGLGFMSGSDPDSPQQQPLARRRQQQKYTRAQSWNFKPAWTDDSGGRIEPRGSGRNIAAAGGSRVDQVLNDLNDGLEQLRRSYSPPGSPYHTATTVPVQTPVLQPQAVQPPLPQQQYAADPVSRPQTAAYLGMQQSVSQPWGQQPAYNTAFVQQPFPYLGHQTQYQLPAGQPQPSYMPPQFAERPHTPADKPLAVPPQQMDEGSLAAARMEYLLDKHRVKAKRMRELQESPSFSLGD
ncbi:hypothetical protein N2152v2_009150 [Parachlorella kessleri]